MERGLSWGSELGLGENQTGAELGAVGLGEPNWGGKPGWGCSRLGELGPGVGRETWG